ncbi:MAG: hypothetical protein ACLP01_25930 [Solirubrobacteraceae bacterium]
MCGICGNDASLLRQAQRHPLERLLAPISPLALIDGRALVGTRDRGVVCVPASGVPQWLHGDGWQLYATPAFVGSQGEEVAVFRAPDGRMVSVKARPDGWIEVPFSLSEAYENYVTERWVPGTGQRRLPPWSLRAFYRGKRRIPRQAQLATRRALIRWQGLPSFPRWPFDASVGKLLELFVRCCLMAAHTDELPFRWFWPRGYRAALILTHDVESEAGIRNAITIADLEEERGLRSSFNIVGDWYPIDWGILAELQQRGFELGVHGLFHDRSLFGDRSEFERQLPLLRAFRGRLRAEGFRSPATYRVNDWLSELPASYDCTIPMSDPYEPQPGGCCSPWPFFLGDVVELPYTMPQDYTLFTLKRERTISTWKRQLESLEEANGLVQCVTHPDPGYLGTPMNRELYVQFLDVVHSRRDVWRALPNEVATWWRHRDAGDGDDLKTGHVVVDSESGRVAFNPPAAVR